MNQVIAIIKQFEGFRDEPYLCPANYWTVGYGHRILDEKGNALKGKGAMAKAHEMFPFKLEEKEAELLLIEDAVKVACDIAVLLEVGINANQMGGLVSLVFNIGIGNFSSSTMLKKLNQGLYDEIPNEFRRWTKANGKVLPGLVKRREAEVELWQATT